MKIFKHVDFYIQAMLISGLTLVALIRQDQTFLIAYLIIGGWQVMSMLVHFINKWYNRPGSRRWYYNRVTLVALVLLGLGFLFPPVFMFLNLMIVAAPLMAIYYVAICFREVFYPAKRPLELI